MRLWPHRGRLQMQKKKKNCVVINSNLVKEFVDRVLLVDRNAFHGFGWYKFLAIFFHLINLLIAIKNNIIYYL
jgi:hypothetical protein